MPSIFIWKSDKQITSNKTIRMYTGSNWILEDNDVSSKSYRLMEQYNSYNSIICNIKNMPRDWIGVDLLEVTQIPYEFITSDNYGTLEQLGNWMRFTSLNDVTNIESEIVRIKEWMKPHIKNTMLK